MIGSFPAKISKTKFVSNKQRFNLIKNTNIYPVKEASIITGGNL